MSAQVCAFCRQRLTTRPTTALAFSPWMAGQPVEGRPCHARCLPKGWNPVGLSELHREGFAAVYTRLSGKPWFDGSALRALAEAAVLAVELPYQLKGGVCSTCGSMDRYASCRNCRRCHRARREKQEAVEALPRD